MMTPRHRAAPTSETRTVIEVVADKGHHKVELLHELGRAEYRTYIPVPDQKGQRRFTDKGGMLAREAFHQQSSARASKQGQEAAPATRRVDRANLRPFACETGAHRRVRLRGRENVRKRYLMYTIQALWTQARESLNVTNVILANRSYAILHLEMLRMGLGPPGPVARQMLDLTRPTLDFVSLGQSMGVPSRRVTRADELVSELRRSFSLSGPSLLEVVID